jgi:2-oxoglutarate ferredoxin oxidoreductase subunit alpha
MSTTVNPNQVNEKMTEQLESVVIRFCGDSGDGMQLAGTQFTSTSAIFGNDICTLPDFPAEIRAPQGTTAGVSGYQLCFSSHEVFTPGDDVDTLFAMNPAALKVNLIDLKRGGTLILNEDEFVKANIQKAGYASNPLDDDQMLTPYKVLKVPMTRLTRDSVEGMGLTVKEADRCKNFFALGLAYWLYERDLGPTLDWVKAKFGKRPEIMDANIKALNAGYNYGLSTDAFTVHFRVDPAKLPPGKYRKISGNEAIALGLVTASKLSGKALFYAGYPITPASDILHELSLLKHYDIRTFQAEDEIAAITSLVGASYTGALAVTASSGPGIALKSEGIGLGVITELPMVIINVQRGGPSTGLPTKTEQSDLLMTFFGRNGECPVPILAACSPADCFEMAQEALRIAVQFMTPVFLLSDGYIGNGAEPWRIPNVADLKPITITHQTTKNGDGKYLPYLRNEKRARPWAVPGTPGLEHRIGGLEKSDVTGTVDYSTDNHQHMVRMRAAKVAGIANYIPDQVVEGAESGDLLIVSWGGTYGSVKTAVSQANKMGKKVGHIHIRYMNPFPKNLAEIFPKFKRVLVPELNLGQLITIIRSTFLVDAKGYNKIKGKPFLVNELMHAINEVLADRQPMA